jgi:hypothetical protein
VTETEEEWAGIEWKWAELDSGKPLQAKECIGAFRRFASQKNTFQVSLGQYLMFFPMIEARSGNSNDRLLALIASPSEPHIAVTVLAMIVASKIRCSTSQSVRPEPEPPDTKSCHANEPSAYTTWAAAIRL